MERVFFIGLIVAIMLGVGLVAGALGVTSSTIAAATLADAPPTQSGFWDGLIQTLTWAWNAAASFFQLMTFQVDIPVLANTFLIVPLGFMMLWLIYHAIRGS
jgi:hypothetical protein